LQDYVPEKRSVLQIPSPKTPGILHESMKPVEPGALDPSWTIMHAAGEKIECGSDAEHHPRIEARQDVPHE
jgi:hypothetical protein